MCIWPEGRPPLWQISPGPFSYQQTNSAPPPQPINYTCVKNLLHLFKAISRSGRWRTLHNKRRLFLILNMHMEWRELTAACARSDKLLSLFGQAGVGGWVAFALAQRWSRVVKLAAAHKSQLCTCKDLFVFWQRRSRLLANDILLVLDGSAQDKTAAGGLYYAGTH